MPELINLNRLNNILRLRTTLGFFENRPGTEIIGIYLMRSEPGVRNELRENAGYILRKKEMVKIPRVRAVRI